MLTIASRRLRVYAVPTLTVRNVDAHLKEQLRVRAASNGRSMEAEVRQILVDTIANNCEPEVNLAEAIRRCFAPYGGVDDLMPHPPVPLRDPPTFEP